GGRAASGGRGDGVSLGGSASPGRSASGSMGGASRRSPASGPVVVSGTSIPVSSPGAASSSGEDGPLRGRSSGGWVRSTHEASRTAHARKTRRGIESTLTPRAHDGENPPAALPPHGLSFAEHLDEAAGRVKAQGE